MSGLRPGLRTGIGVGWRPGRHQRRILRLQPVLKVLAAAIAILWQGLVHAGSVALGAGDADVEMEVMPPHRAHLGEPGAIRTGIAAEGHLDRRIDENA